MTVPFTAGDWPMVAPLRQALVDAEKAMSSSMEQLVDSKGFTEVLGQAAENLVALTTLNAGVWDLVLRNLRMAGRADVDRLGQRLNQIEDKLEVLLQELERLGDDRAQTGGSA
ncbi:MAG: hypothetical protein JWO02_447 [Solirubrobacterales bacterium]|nr:hypothetical protein [Solirubrobacterales bacterium]